MCAACIFLIASIALFEGDTGFAYADNVARLCEACAPTFGDCFEYQHPDAYETEEEYEEALDYLKSQPADKKNVWPL